MKQTIDKILATIERKINMLSDLHYMLRIIIKKRNDIRFKSLMLSIKDLNGSDTVSVLKCSEHLQRLHNKQI